MNLYLIYQNINDNYDTFDSAVVVAESAAHARMVHPTANRENWDGKDDGVWADTDYVSADYVGVADSHLKAGTVICSSFNAG